jgi:hypothetical protein
MVLPEAIAVPHADQQLDAMGAPTDARTADLVPKILDAFLSLAARLRPT